MKNMFAVLNVSVKDISVTHIKDKFILTSSCDGIKRHVLIVTQSYQTTQIKVNGDLSS